MVGCWIDVRLGDEVNGFLAEELRRIGHRIHPWCKRRAQIFASHRRCPNGVTMWHCLSCGTDVIDTADADWKGGMDSARPFRRLCGTSRMSWTIVGVGLGLHVLKTFPAPKKGVFWFI